MRVLDKTLDLANRTDEILLKTFNHGPLQSVKVKAVLAAVAGELVALEERLERLERKALLRPGRRS